MINGLIQQQEIASLRYQQRQRQSRPFAITQLPNWPQRIIPTEQKVVQKIPRIRLVERGRLQNRFQSS